MKKSQIKIYLYMCRDSITKKYLKERDNMELEFKKDICGFDFVKVGEAYLCNEPLKAKFNGSDLKDYKLAVKFIDIENKKDLLTIEQSTYLVYEENTLIYIGYYSNSFKKRWLREQNNNFYIWHSSTVDDYINPKLKTNPNKKFTIWITTNPYAELANNISVNISKVIEDTIIMHYANEKTLLNKVGKSLKEQKNKTKSIMEILNIK